MSGIFAIDVFYYPTAREVALTHVQSFRYSLKEKTVFYGGEILVVAFYGLFWPIIPLAFFVFSYFLPAEDHKEEWGVDEADIYEFRGMLALATVAAIALASYIGVVMLVVPAWYDDWKGVMEGVRVYLTFALLAALYMESVFIDIRR